MELAITQKENKIIPLNITLSENTPEWLRSFKGCENYTDNEALDILNTLDVFATILLETASKIITNIDNQQVVSLISQNEPIKLAA